MTIEELTLLKADIQDDYDAWTILPNTSSTGIACLKLIEAEIARQSVTSEEGPCWYCIGIESHGIATVKTVTDEYGCELGAYDTPYNHCPNCGRKLREE